MRDFNRGGRFSERSSRSSGSRSSGGGRFSGGGRRSSGPVTMHSAVCAECGESCEVPFRPTGDKPVYCDKCFSSRRPDEKAFRDSTRRFEGGSGRYNDRSRSFGDRQERFSGTKTDQYAGQFRTINEKLDKLLKILSVDSRNEVKKSDIEDAILEVTKEIPVDTPTVKQKSLKAVKPKKVAVKKVPKKNKMDK